ncbi:MAG: uroporphyrinogen-III synthase [Pseudomonadota bacterium]
MTQTLTGFQVISFESRLRTEAAGLLEKHGARVSSAPALRELPLADFPDAKLLADSVGRGGVDALLLLTGIGTTLLLKAAATHRPKVELVEALSRIALICRGPKPSAALKPFGLRPTFSVPEPNTWRELVSKLDSDWPVAGRHVAIQEYGVQNTELVRALSERGALVTNLKVYTSELPLDTGPLKAAILKIVRGQAQVALFTNARQIDHLLRVAAEIGLAPAVRRALNNELVVASMGPVTSEALNRNGVAADITPGHPKLGHLVLAVARRAPALLADKRDRGAASARIGK